MVFLFCYDTCMEYVKYLLNLPWTIIAFVASLISIPISISVKNSAVVMNIRSFWWYPARGIRALTLGNVILLGRHLMDKDLEHECVHIEQHMREPFIKPILSLVEVMKHGHKNSKYEKEAYGRTGNKFVDK